MGLKQKKFLIVTGGVISGIGKGVAAASIGRIFKDTLKVVPIKCDGYLNTDPGTMNPIEHGEVFVLDDGGEVDMDFGHYERFLGINASSKCNITMGKVYKQILENERQGKYLGKTVQLIPHVTNEIKRRIYQIAEEEDADLVLVEIGGTIGDMENELFVESIRQLGNEVGHENVMFIHLTYIPIPSGTKEQKSKPTQQSVKILNQAGIYPDMIIGRCEKMITPLVQEKISMHCNIDKGAVISGLDVDFIYELPLVFEQQNVSKIIQKRLNFETSSDMKETENLVSILKRNKKNPRVVRKIAICGKYTDLEDSYASIAEALKHCSAHLDCRIDQVFIDTTDIAEENVPALLDGVHGVIVPGGFGSRGMEGKINVIKYLRENNIPFLGICLGMQLAVVEFGRNVSNIKEASSNEVGKEGITVNEPLIDILPEQLHVKEVGASMRLGGHDIEVKKGTRAYDLYNSGLIRERFRHRYEVNPKYIKRLEETGLVFSGKAPDKDIMQIIELPDHPFFMAAQFHPELTSRFEKPSVLFYHFAKTCLERN